jgi:hypothetical protein
LNGFKLFHAKMVKPLEYEFLIDFTEEAFVLFVILFQE